MVQIGPNSDFGCQVLEWDKTVAHMKETGNLPFQPELNKRNMQEEVIHTSEPSSTIEDTDRVVKNST